MTEKTSETTKSTRIYMQPWPAGAHIGFSAKIAPSVAESIAYGMYTTQFFMGNPKTYNRQKISKEDIENTRALLTKFPMNVFTHFPYIANLNGSVSSLAWNGDTAIDGKMRHMMKELEYELAVLSNFSDYGSCGVVIHPGCFPNREKGLSTIATTINKLHFTGESKLILENCAGEGRKLCRDIEEIAAIFDELDEEVKNNVGVCIDTAHIWGQGDYDISKISEIDRLFTDFDKLLGMERFSLLHLNDSAVGFGSKVDRHESITKGNIWSKDSSSLIYLLNKCEKYNIPIVLETQPSDMLILTQLAD